MSEIPDVMLVIPAYCEEKRLPHYFPSLVAELGAASFKTMIQIVDDGSPEDAYRSLTNAIPCGEQGNCAVRPILRLPKNAGKGAAILAGWAHVPASRWLAFVDADGAIPASSVQTLLQKVVDGSPDRCVIGSRLQPHNVKRNPLRNIMGTIFRLITALILGRKVQDTQCGLKALPHAALSKMQPLITEHRFAFDVNLLLAAETCGIPIEDHPVLFRDVGGGKINPLCDGIRMLGSVFRLGRMRKQWKKPMTDFSRGQSHAV